jgi:hypothetical protein
VSDFIHAKCLGIRKDDHGHTLVCAKSKGHANPQCYDPSADVYFLAELKPKERKHRGA